MATDLCLQVSESQEGAEFSLTYNRSIYEEVVENLQVYFNTLLENAVQDGQTPLTRMQYLPEAEVNRLLFGVNDTRLDLGIDAPIHTCFERCVRERADHVAVIHQDLQITYRVLNEQANQCAALLGGLGLSGNPFAGIYLERSVELVIFLVGILKAGKSYVPFDLNNPAERTRKLINNSETEVLFTSVALLKEQPALFRTLRTVKYVICPEACPPADKLRFAQEYGITVLGGQDLGNALAGDGHVACSPDAWAYMLYTSGSTGDPKGAITHHRGALNHIFAEFKALSLPPGFRFLQSANIASDISVWQILAPLVGGGAVVIIDKNDLLDYGYLVRAIRNYNVTIAEFVPSFLKGFMAFLETTAYQALPDLRWMMVVGEEGPAKIVNQWLSLYPACRMLNGYGPCEASDDITQYIIEAPLPENEVKVPIGKPLFNLNIFVLNKNAGLVPYGAVGEICVSGVGVGYGYWKDPDKTRLSFIQNGFAGTQGETIYRTGDLGRWRSDGNLEFLGRADSQVKIRGFRVETGEIESCLRSLPMVSDAAVKIADAGNDPAIIAYVVPAAGHAARTPEIVAYQIREELRTALPAYMLPARIVLLQSFPRNLSDKIDYAALEPPAEMDALHAAYEAPATETEAILLTCWKEVLGKKCLSVTENFFEVGGHSLLAAQIFSRIHRGFSIRITLNHIFANPTIRQLARVIDSLDRSEHSAMQPVEECDHYGLSGAQKRIWVLSQFTEQTFAYNMRSSFTFKGDLDVGTLRRAFEAVIRHHEGLRTNIIVVAGEPRQKIAPHHANPVPLEFVDLRGPMADPARLKRLVAEVLNHNFRLEKDLLLRARVLQTGDQAFVVVFAIHHIICDGWSAELLVAEINAAYHALRSGGPYEQPPLPLQYKDYAAWQKRSLRSKLFQAHHQHWIGQFRTGVPVLDLPLDAPRHAVKSYRGDKISFTLDAGLTALLRKTARHKETTMFMITLAMVAGVLSRWCRQHDMVIGTPVVSRNDVAFEKIIGILLNVIALRFSFSPRHSLEELLDHVKQVVLEGFAHQDYPMDLLVEQLNVKKDYSRSALFDVSLSYERLTNASGGRAGGIPAVEGEGAQFTFNTNWHDLEFYVLELDQFMVIHLVYNSDLFRGETMECLRDALLECAAAFRDIATPLEELRFAASLDKWEVDYAERLDLKTRPVDDQF
jgi:amino acid adenylation domain-containing protein